MKTNVKILAGAALLAALSALSGCAVQTVYGPPPATEAPAPTPTEVPTPTPTEVPAPTPTATVPNVQSVYGPPSYFSGQ